VFSFLSLRRAISEPLGEALGAFSAIAPAICAARSWCARVTKWANCSAASRRCSAA
jgi:hypothetical protein